MPEVEGEHALGRLLRTARESRGWTAGDVSRRIGFKPDGKTPIKRDTTLAGIEKDPRVNLPETETIRQLAEGYDLPERLILDAAAESVGISRRSDDVPEIAVRLEAPRYRDLSPHHVSLIVAVTDAILTGEQGSPKPA